MQLEPMVRCGEIISEKNINDADKVQSAETVDSSRVFEGSVEACPHFAHMGLDNLESAH